MPHARTLLAAAVFSALAPGLARAKDLPVDLELVLAVDVSRSMDAEEQELQRQGYIAALRHPDVIAAIQSGPLGRIAITYYEWSGANSQRIIVPWSMIEDGEGADAVAERISPGEVYGRYGTSISSSLLFGAALFEHNGFAGARRTIDISGDGPNNMGPPVTPIRDAVVARGITINGLAITLREPRQNGSAAFDIDNLDLYYRDCVVGGVGAFMVAVTSVGQFEEAIRRKLVTEIADKGPVILPVADQREVPQADCLVGESIGSPKLSR
ncbi:hypothetical protein K32_32020 [Kaistia sp. 32K]|uniref:DUF1194 domain-containing protein n=1 Tax=Kaistia sp. 32K TaxID=2795690 RepID=UPI0019157D77|nr:DUF1194 domain-containing protein [Kaistia sp. 32K]BCP54585.1 hypothetical protein K32_32020 [Kaistia sp. 32K]